MRKHQVHQASRNRLDFMMQFYRSNVDNADECTPFVMTELTDQIGRETSSCALQVLQDRYCLILRNCSKQFALCYYEPQRLIGKRKRTEEDEQAAFQKCHCYSSMICRALLYDTKTGDRNVTTMICSIPCQIQQKMKGETLSGNSGVSAHYDCLEFFNAVTKFMLRNMITAVSDNCAIVSFLSQMLSGLKILILDIGDLKRHLLMKKLDDILQIILKECFEAEEFLFCGNLMSLWIEIVLILEEGSRCLNDEDSIEGYNDPSIPFLRLILNVRTRGSLMLARIIFSLIKHATARQLRLSTLTCSTLEAMTCVLVTSGAVDVFDRQMFSISLPYLMVNIAENDGDLFSWMLHCAYIEIFCKSKSNGYDVTSSHLFILWTKFQKCGFTMIRTFVLFLAAILFYDSDVLIDFISANETQALLYFSTCLKHINKEEFQEFVGSNNGKRFAVPQRNCFCTFNGLGRIENKDKRTILSRMNNSHKLVNINYIEVSIEIDLVNKFLREVRQKLSYHYKSNILPFNPSLLCKRITTLLSDH